MGTNDDVLFLSLSLTVIMCFHLPSAPCSHWENMPWLAQFLEENERVLGADKDPTCYLMLPVESNLDLASSKQICRYVSKYLLMVCHRESVVTSLPAVAD